MKKSKSQKKLASRLNRNFCICLFLVSAIVLAIGASAALGALRDAYKSETKTILTMLNNKISDFETTVKTAGDISAGNNRLISAVASKNGQAISEYLTELKDTYSISYLYVTDKKGTVIHLNSAYSNLYDLSAYDHISAAQNGDSKVTYQAILGDDLCINYGAPIYKNDEIIGIISLSFSLADNSILDNLKGDGTNEFTLFLEDQRINTTIKKGSSRQVGTILDKKIADIVLIQGKEYSGLTDVLGSNYMTYYMPLVDQNGKTIGAAFAGKEFDGVIKRTASAISIAFVAAAFMYVIVFILLKRFFKDNITDPLNQITRISENLENGDIGIANTDSIKVNIKTNDEIGQVTRSFSNSLAILQSYIHDINDVLSSLAVGDLAASSQMEYKGDFVNIKKALEKIAGSMRVIITDIITSSDAIASSSHSISNGAINLSQSTSEQASATEELSATVSEVSENIKSTASHAATANKISNDFLKDVQIGKSNIEETLNSMNEISKISTEINKINKAVSDIAFQTNILALNAAVESARAGAAGKGFAVVSDEVRKLAVRSADAANQTGQLIKNTIRLVKKGTQIAENTSESFEKILEGSQKSSEIIDEIAKSAAVQAKAVEQISRGVNQIAEGVQENAATSEENAAASEELIKQAGILQKSVEIFNLEKETGRSDN